MLLVVYLLFDSVLNLLGAFHSLVHASYSSCLLKLCNGKHICASLFNDLGMIVNL